MESLILLAPPFWLGLVVAISFIEAPLKFRAPGVTPALGLGIGRLVFRALNLAELVVGALLLLACASGGARTVGWALPTSVVAVLLAQLVAVSPFLARRTSRVLDRPEAAEGRSRAHDAYIGLEAVKALGLILLCVRAVSGRSG